MPHDGSCLPSTARYWVGRSTRGNCQSASSNGSPQPRTSSLCGYRPSQIRLTLGARLIKTAALPSAIRTCNIGPARTIESSCHAADGKHVFLSPGGQTRRMGNSAQAVGAPVSVACGEACRSDRGIAQPNYDHISAADGSEFVSLDGGDSGGPVVTYDMHLIGIISSSDERTRSILFYTPMSQVLQELHDYTLAPINTSDEKHRLGTGAGGR
ncbi:trypsin-like serine protease [Xanthomonas oryzae pv. oryzae]|nr:trypsin-like serine protease [Xanthomonas oryzae pv. oryzae]